MFVSILLNFIRVVFVRYCVIDCLFLKFCSRSCWVKRVVRNDFRKMFGMSLVLNLSFFKGVDRNSISMFVEGLVKVMFLMEIGLNVCWVMVVVN